MGVLTVDDLERLIEQADPDLSGYTPAELADMHDACGDGITRLREFQDALTDAIVAQTKPFDVIEAGDGRRWRVRRGSKKSTWDTDALRAVLLARGRDEQRIDLDTGEVLESEGEAVLRVWMDCAAVSYFRKGKLTEYGVDPDEYVTTEPGRLTIKREDDVA